MMQAWCFTICSISSLEMSDLERGVEGGFAQRGCKCTFLAPLSLVLQLD